MRVNIGPYVHWFGPYQLADTLRLVGVGEDRRYEIGKYLSKTWVGSFLSWVYSKRKRRESVRIDRWDTWNADHTLALVILPLLRNLKEDNHGAPLVDDELVPDELRSTAAPPKENEWDTDENHFKRWDWVMDEMIWAFEQVVDSDGWESQFYTGEADIQWEPAKLEGSDQELYEMKRGPKDTFKFDKEGYEAHQARIQRGLEFFGKFYQALWT